MKLLGTDFHIRLKTDSRSSIWGIQIINIYSFVFFVNYVAKYSKNNLTIFYRCTYNEITILYKVQRIIVAASFRCDCFFCRTKLASLSRKVSTEDALSLFLSSTMCRKHKYRRIFFALILKAIYDSMVHLMLFIEIVCHKHMACYCRMRINGPGL